jgi:glycosyltransferase involved in cell wall biosynthesis
MSLRLALNLRDFEPGQAAAGEAFVRGVLPPLAAKLAAERGGVVLLAPVNQATSLSALAPEAEVRAPDASLSGVDVLLCPLGPLDPVAPPVAALATLVDLRHELDPAGLAARDVERLTRSWRRTAASGVPVLTFSEFGQRALVDIYGFDEERVVVAPLAPRRSFEDTGDPGLGADCLVCEREPRRALLEALALLTRNGASPRLLIASGTLAGVEEVRAEAEELGLADLVRFIGRPPERRAAEILKGARALVEPSAAEVFPVAVADAFAAGTPVVAAREGGAGELAGDAALLVDTDDARQLAAGLERVLSEPDLARELVDRGHRRASGLSWERTAETLLEAASSAAGRGRIEVRTEPPLVSVVTPSLNMADYLRHAADSVLSQDYPRLEYLVMDGGSDDGTVELLRSYGDRLRFVSEPDRGQADAINRGFRSTSGEIVAFLNADDTYLPGAVSRAVRGFFDNPEAAVVYGDGLHVNEDGEPVERYPTLDFDPDAFMRGSYICQPAALISRSALERVGLLDDRLQVAIDYDLWIRLSRLYPFARVDELLATSRMHAKAKTTAIRRTAYREGIALVKRHFGYVPLDWLDGYAQFLVEGKDQFFVRSRPGPRSRALALAMGLRHNPLQARRFWREWATDAGLRRFEGRWDDGWISRYYVDEIDVPGDCRHVRVAGRHEAGMKGPLELSVHLEGVPIARLRATERKRFEIAGRCPPQARGRSSRLEITANRTWVPRARGDRRRVSCVIDSITLE